MDIVFYFVLLNKESIFGFPSTFPNTDQNIYNNSYSILFYYFTILIIIVSQFSTLSLFILITLWFSVLDTG